MIVTMPRIGVRYRTIFANTGSLLGTTVTTAALGFAFWWLAAKLLSADSIGYASASVSAMTLLATVGTLGLGTALIAEMAEQPQRSAALLSGSLIVSGAAGGALGVVLVVVIRLAPSGRFLPFDTVGAGLIVLGTALTSAAAVLDFAFIGMLMGGLQLTRNVIFSVAKLALIGAIAAALPDARGKAALLAWDLGIVISALWMAVAIRVRGLRLLARPNMSILLRLPRAGAGHSWLNIVLDAPHLVIPVLATALVSPAKGAAFYVAWTLLAFSYVLPFHLGTTLYAVGATNRPGVRRNARFTLRLALLGGVVGVPILMFGGPVVLRLFGPGYAAAATAPLRILALGYFPMVILAHFVALRRIEGRVKNTALIVSVLGLVEIGAGALGAEVGDVLGLALGVLLAKWLQALVTTPFVLRALREPTPPADVEPADGNPTESKARRA